MNAEVVATFLCDVSQEFAAHGLDPDAFCFLIHRFLPASAGSYSVGRPNIARVRVDSTWGVPDGLLYLPHDSFEVNLADPGAMWRKLRCKSHYVDFESDGTWYEKTAGSPWDWAQSVTADDLHMIAQQTLDLANYEGQPVEVMHFVQVHPATGLPRVIPWFFRPSDVPSTQAESAPRVDPNRAAVRSMGDVREVEKQLETDDSDSISGLAIKADCEHLHSQEFVLEVARIAKAHQLPVDMEGSVLAHAYYLLHAEGVRARCIDAASPPVEGGSRSFDKLVRDSIPERIEGGGERTVVEHAEGDSLLGLLKAKAVEEILELYEAESDEQVVAEAADVIEVLRAICEPLGVDTSELLKIADTKRADRGGFEKGIVLRRTFVPPALGSPVPGELFATSGAPTEVAIARAHGIRLTRRRDRAGNAIVQLEFSRVPPLSREPTTIDLAALGGMGYLRLIQGIESITVELGGGRAPLQDNQLSLFEKPAP